MAQRQRKSKTKDHRPAGLKKKLLLLLGTIVFFLAVGEVVLRRLYPMETEDRWNQHHFRVDALGFNELNEIMEPDPDLFWRVMPNLKDRYLSGFVGTDIMLHFKVETDENGLRKMPLQDSEKNILFLGDSCTFGIGVRARETCAALTGIALDMNVRNLACPGYTIFQGRTLLDRLGWMPEPIALVVAFGFNDRLMWDGRTDPEHATILAKKSSFLARYSRLFYCAELAVEGSLNLLKKKREDSSPLAQRVPPALFKAEAASLVEAAKARKVPVVFLFWPRIEWMEDGGNHPYAATISDLAE
ncbi:MAG: SGNH/GDSL hydrolase family protein, partial [Planctomycetes bacterium]|nr:SGNH/GDSL hydrolase family protein [Planctomycetota bacterium]